MKRIIIYAANFCFRNIPIHIICMVLALFPACTTVNYIRGFLVKPFFGHCGKHFQLAKGCIINHPENLYIGDNCYISYNCYIQAKGIIHLEDHVIIGPMSILASSDHIIMDGVVTNKGKSFPINIGRCTWCGGNVTIRGGVSIGESVIIGAGAVVTKDIHPYSKAFGVPAKEKETKIIDKIQRKELT